ncbi:hypothetical protein P167DRAFT_542630 [Morchella conica CCBAS932]|uniref:BTB domain-containing protein n=1 Tax=Morchella conica CCBAS932 TaxID=1392247 RepID=A0A3N4L374_9PEZI|nr:hypothetical protein P167DRAFT_542630 [Morchella conica CCBAS932]
MAIVIVYSFTQNLGLLASEIIEVIAESGQECFHVHSSIFAAKSRTLRRATKGVKRLDLSNWDGNTVARFLQFLYIGSYQIPESRLIERSEGDESVDGEMSPNTAQRRKNSEVGNALNFLLTHAKIYTLAACYDVEELRVISFKNLQRALGRIDVGEQTARVVEMLEYIYSHTSCGEPIRELVSRFSAENLQTLLGPIDMHLLLYEGGDFAVELVENVSKRLSSAERKLRGVERKLSAMVKGLQNSKPALRISWFNTDLLFWAFSRFPHKSFRITLGVLISAATITNVINYQSETISSTTFQNLCKHYSTRSWVDSDMLAVGNQPLKEACLDHVPGTRVPKPYILAYNEVWVPEMCEMTSWLARGEYNVNEAAAGAVDTSTGSENAGMPTAKSVHKTFSEDAEPRDIISFITHPVSLFVLLVAGYYSYVHLFVVHVARPSGMESIPRRRGFIYPTDSRDAI